MALGTPTIGTVLNVPPEPFQLIPVSFAGDGAYSAGGTVLSTISAIKTALGTKKIIGIIQQDCGGYDARYIPSTDKLKVYYGDNNNASDGPLIENATADLSSTTFNIILIAR